MFHSHMISCSPSVINAKSSTIQIFTDISTATSTAHDQMVFFFARTSNLPRINFLKSWRSVWKTGKVERILKIITIMGTLFSRWRVSVVKTVDLSFNIVDIFS